MSEKPPVNNSGDDSDELRELWQGQNLEIGKIPFAELRQKAGKFETAIRRRNFREYIGSAFVVIFFGRVAFGASNTGFRVGAGLIVAAAIYIAYVLHTHGSSQHAPDDTGRLTIVRFHRLSLERQRDLLRSIWRWYLLPFVPGFTLLALSAAVHAGVIMNPSRTPAQLRRGFVLLGIAALQAGGLFVIAALNKRAACKLQMKIDVLDAEERE